MKGEGVEWDLSAKSKALCNGGSTGKQDMEGKLGVGGASTPGGACAAVSKGKELLPWHGFGIDCSRLLGRTGRWGKWRAYLFLQQVLRRRLLTGPDVAQQVAGAQSLYPDDQAQDQGEGARDDDGPAMEAQEALVCAQEKGGQDEDERDEDEDGVDDAGRQRRGRLFEQDVVGDVADGQVLG